MIVSLKCSNSRSQRLQKLLEVGRDIQQEAGLIIKFLFDLISLSYFYFLIIGLNQYDLNLKVLLLINQIFDVKNVSPCQLFHSVLRFCILRGFHHFFVLYSEWFQSTFFFQELYQSHALKKGDLPFSSVVPNFSISFGATLDLFVMLLHYRV